jgi:hypothetical protein
MHKRGFQPITILAASSWQQEYTEGGTGIKTKGILSGWNLVALPGEVVPGGLGMGAKKIANGGQ